MDFWNCNSAKTAAINLTLRPLGLRWPFSAPARRRIFGIDAHQIDVEVDMYPGKNRDFITVGMPDTAVGESRERIKSALMNSGFGYPNKSVTINLAPANVRKEGAGFDLPMALGILGAMGVVGPAEDHLFVGELSLDGAIRPVRGAVDRRLHTPEGSKKSARPSGPYGRGGGRRWSPGVRDAALVRGGRVPPQTGRV
jgi:hypothetical protein